MISKKRNSKKNQLGRILSEPELRGKTKSPKAQVEDSEVFMSKSPRSTHILNLQIPSSKPRKSALIHRPSKHGEEKEVEQITREKNSLLAKVTALQHEIFVVKKQNKQLRENVRKNKALEDQLREAYSENLALKGEAHTDWKTIEESMHEFKNVLYNYMGQD